jgi:hypothetical protein
LLVGARPARTLWWNETKRCWPRRRRRSIAILHGGEKHLHSEIDFNDEPGSNREAFRRLQLEWCEGRDGISVLDSNEDEIESLGEEAIQSLIAREWLAGHDHVTVYKVEHKAEDGTISFHSGVLQTLDEVLGAMRQQAIQRQEQAQRDLEYAASLPGLIAKAMAALRLGADITSIVDQLEKLHSADQEAVMFLTWNAFVTDVAPTPVVDGNTAEPFDVSAAIIHAASLRRAGYKTAIPDALVSAAIAASSINCLNDTFIELLGHSPDDLNLSADAFEFLHGCIHRDCQPYLYAKLASQLTPAENLALCNLAKRLATRRSNSLESDVALLMMNLSIDDVAEANEAASRTIDTIMQMLSSECGTIYWPLSEETPLGTEAATLLTAVASSRANADVIAAVKSLVSTGRWDRYESVG